MLKTYNAKKKKKTILLYNFNKHYRDVDVRATADQPAGILI